MNLFFLIIILVNLLHLTSSISFENLDDIHYDNEKVQSINHEHDFKNSWYLVNQTKNSFQPTPRSFPHFFKKNATHGILYGGFQERIQILDGNNIFYNQIFFINAKDPRQVEWSLVTPASSIAPIPRSIECAVYSHSLDALYIFGGTRYNANFTGIVFFQDSWVFHFSTRTWQLLSSTNPPGLLAGMGCDVFSKDNDQVAIVTLGSGGVNLEFPQTTWRWNLVTNTWASITVSYHRPIPVGRFQFEFQQIPHTSTLSSSLFLLANGQFTPTNFTNTYLTDVWTLDVNLNTNTGTWQQLTVKNIPQPIISTPGYALTSKKFLLMTGGDRGLSNLTLNETCPTTTCPNLACVVKTNPTNLNFWLNLKLENNLAIWEEAHFIHSIPPSRKPSNPMLILQPYIYLVGGLGWDGFHCTGEIYNPYTLAIKINEEKFFN